MNSTRSARRDRAWRRALQTPIGIVAASMLVLLAVLAVAAPILWGDAATKIDTSAISQGPSAQHLLGTDTLGRDLFFRVLVATRLSILLAVITAAIGVTVGLVLGSAPWLLGGAVGRAVVAFINLMIAFPYLLLALFFTVVFGIGVIGATVAIGLAMAPWFARLTHTLIAGIQGRDYLAAARTHGQGRVRILLRHVFPNIAEPLVVNATIAAGNALVAFAGLSFLGIGVQAPAYDWGLLLNEGLHSIYLHPAGALAPGVAIIIAGLGFNLLGETVASRLGHPSVGMMGQPQRRRTSEAAVPAAPREVKAPSSPDAPILEVEDLVVSLNSGAGPAPIVHAVSFSVSAGESIGLVGESGSGKSLTALAIAQLLEPPFEVQARRLRFRGVDLLAQPTAATRQTLGTSLGMVFQNPTTSLNPTIKVGAQLAEVLQVHAGERRRNAFARAIERLAQVRIPAAARRARQYPHEYSGGMRQRAMIAMALMGESSLIIADEPTTALDVTVQRRVLDLLGEIRRTRHAALLLISHDISAIRHLCDRVLVMYAGRIVEDLPVTDLLDGARHPYTRALVAAVPSVTSDRELPLVTIPGKPADPIQPVIGCAYAPRCPLADDRCRTVDPPLNADAHGNRVACWHAGEPITSVTTWTEVGQDAR